MHCPVYIISVRGRGAAWAWVCTKTVLPHAKTTCRIEKVQIWVMKVLSRSQCQRDDKYIFILLTLRVDRGASQFGRRCSASGKGRRLFARIVVVVRSMCEDRDHKFWVELLCLNKWNRIDHIACVARLTGLNYRSHGPIISYGSKEN